MTCPQPAGKAADKAADEEASDGQAASVRRLYDSALARTAGHDPRALQRYLAVLAAAPAAG